VGGGPRNNIAADYPPHVSVGGTGESDSFYGRYAGGRAGGVGGKIFLLRY
jgi:hypothetical protein